MGSRAQTASAWTGPDTANCVERTPLTFHPTKTYLSGKGAHTAVGSTDGESTEPTAAHPGALTTMPYFVVRTTAHSSRNWGEADMGRSTATVAFGDVAFRPTQPLKTYLQPGGAGGAAAYIETTEPAG